MCLAIPGKVVSTYEALKQLDQLGELDAPDVDAVLPDHGGTRT